ncbi:MAG: hypothetical protein JWR80_5990 [Bradyrhizobium sp.]|nr:hypothetical protein [Bradyrhizobium sp.]
MPIEIIVGLPHLNEGPILATARRLQLPILISANALSRWTPIDGAREWTGWRAGLLSHAAGLISLDLDSAGFVAMARYRGFPWTVDAYFKLARAFPFRRIASLDYCTEAEIAADREEVLDRISRTIRANRECALRADEDGLTHSFMPVLQGRRPEDYERCADALWALLRPGSVIGLGSMCRRAVGGPEGVIAVVEHLDRVLPDEIRLHAFGVKGSALPYLKPLERRIASIDSQAYGIAARRDAHRRHVQKTDALVAAHLEAWVLRQHKCLAVPERFPAPATNNLPERTAESPWEAAVARARAEIRALIEAGDLDHDEITDAWVESWAADLQHSVAAHG